MNTNETLRVNSMLEVHSVDLNDRIKITMGVNITRTEEMSIEETKLLIEFLTAQVRKFEPNHAPIPPDVAEKVLLARDAFLDGDDDSVWHHLYSIASPNFDKTEPWEDLEKIAGRLK